MRGDSYDLAVVGAGIIGLSLAAIAHARGLRVVVVERGTAITGSSIRNFGHIGTSVHAGEVAVYAERTHALWLRFAEQAGFWLGRTGTLVVARHDDEMAMIEESGAAGILTANQVSDRAPVVGAVGGVFRERDLQVDPREATTAIAAWLAASGVTFRWRTSALGAADGVLHTSRGEINASATVFATGFDIDQLFPAIAEEYGVERCGLDMLLMEGVGLRVPTLTGSSMLRYSAFSSTPSAAAVRARFERDEPGILSFDINQMYTERPDGTLLVGDTHATSSSISPFQDEDAFRLLERLAINMFGRPLAVRQRWQGVYAKAPHEFLRASPAGDVRVVAVTTGIGMTTGPGLAASVIDDLFGEQ